MRIVIDMQGAQTESRFRGIGRYTMAFAQAVVRNRGEHEVVLALSGFFPDTIEPIRAAFDGVLPQENIRVWYAPGPVRDEDPNNTARREVAELVREAFLASLCPDVIHIPSLFEGYVDDAVTSVRRFDHRTPVSVTLHDLIPLLSPDQYLAPNPNFAGYYHRKIDSLKSASLFIAISESSRREALTCLGAPEEMAVNASEGVDAVFHPLTVPEDQADSLQRNFGLSRPFVLYTGGADERKNLPRLIEAWSKLPAALRQAHQLLFAGRMPDGNVSELRHIAKRHGLKDDELLFSGYVRDEELVQLYNLCKLYVFPSWHEGFGLPALEAMACGAPVIGANTTSLPEVIGLEEALFDPFDVASISERVARALEDEAFHARLRRHGLQQAKKFSWDETAKRTIFAWESLHSKRLEQSPSLCQRRSKPKLAFVSPMPPERTGIADYSAELLPALSAHYDIELVVAQEKVDDPWVNEHCNVRDEAWLRAHAAEVDRVLYQMGNSPFHRHMLRLMEEIPGTVVLHDFYLSGLMAWEELCGGAAGTWTRALYDSHGYGAVRDRFGNSEEAKRRYPVNWQVLQHAQGVIVHSEYSCRLAQQWYGRDASKDWEIVPLLRAPQSEIPREKARKCLGIHPNEFIVCSFGFLADVKLNHRLLRAWLDSKLARDASCRLVFVGENDGGTYGATLLRLIRESGLEKRITITGFASPETFRQYLAATDIAIQLRTHSRGETSAAVLDCMNHGLPLIVNANGSMAELDANAVWMLPDEFSDAELKDALEALWSDSDRRHAIGAKARQIILDRHAPAACARQYAQAIESFHGRAKGGLVELARAIATQNSLSSDESWLLQLSQALATNFPLARPAKRIFLDLTATCRHDLKTGIERVARAITVALLESPPPGYRIEPVYLSEVAGIWHHCYARNYTMALIGCPTGGLIDEPIDPQQGDVLLGLDISGDSLVQAESAGLFARYRDLGVSVQWMVHDLLPIQMPHVFPEGASNNHARWLRSISNFDGAICVSSTVAEDLASWREKFCVSQDQRRSYRVSWSHHGADLGSSAPSLGLPDDAQSLLRELNSRPSFLMVGTVEPRKGYLQALEAFSQLWRDGVNVNLVIVGREGWIGLPDDMRRDIPETVARLRDHPERGHRLFWLEGISDEYLERVYAASTCLIAASYGEGFGLPLIEAAQHKLPIIARDIPVFREVGGEHASYFNASAPSELAQAITQWLTLHRAGQHPKSAGMRWLTWSESTRRLQDALLRLQN